MGNRCERQNALLQVAQPTSGARDSCWSDPCVCKWDERGIIVLFEKHVHLQNDGTAVDNQNIS